MVKKLSHKDEIAIREAIALAAKRSSAKISVVVLPASDHYRDFILLWGFAVGTAISLAVWALTNFAIFPWLLVIQFATVTIVELTPPLRRLCIQMTSRRMRHLRAEAMARQEYLVHHAEIPKVTPYVLLFVSLAERYVHVVTNPVVHAKLPDHWQAVTGQFIASIRKKGLAPTCVQAVEHIAEILEPHFPN